MAEIQLHNVSLSYSSSLRDPAIRLFEKKRELIQEDLPVETPNGGGVLALDNINLTIPNGQTFAVVGPSGCGKSTLLRVVAGIVSDYKGQVLYDGEDVQNILPKDRYIGMVFQNYALYPNFNNEGNLSFFFKLRKISDEETNERIRYTSEMMGIGFNELLPRRPGTLSGGQKQRVAIARAIVRAPKLFLFDEPLSNLDAKLRVQTRTEIKRLLHRFGITSLYVTHDQVEAIALADQIVVMHKGRIEQVGTYQELMDNPASEFVAGFLGLPPMNLFSGGSISGGKLVLDEYLIPIPKNIFTKVTNGQLVTLGMRREAVKLSAESNSANEIQLKGEVEALEPDYSRQSQTVYIRTGHRTYTSMCPLDMKLNIGQLVNVKIDPERLYFFDTNSGLRL
ncbi:MAG: ATP-binding cassette domain-containing protein [Anaerolineales bacterium]|nr:ATP-binding cassette domain-containing protein [Anaerolineales bacterium]